MKKTILLIAGAILTLLAPSADGFAQNATSNSALASFEALQKGNSVQISWTALYEANVYRHEIQKSSNGSSFNTIGSLIAENSATPYRYNFLDATPAEGKNYYRLRTIDKQGNETLSNILLVNNGFGRTNVSVLPNPVQGGVLNLQLSNINGGKYVIALYSSGGQKVFARSFDLSDGSVTETINLPRNLSRGIYVLQFTNAEMRINKQLLIQ